MKEDELRSHIVGKLRDGVPLNMSEREDIAAVVERHWLCDPKRDRDVARAMKAWDIRQEIKQLVRDKGILVKDAHVTLARKHGHNGGPALERWINRCLQHYVNR